MTPPPSHARPTSPTVDVIIPVHDASRPVARAIASLELGSSASSIVVTVVCHNLSATTMRHALGHELDARVRLVEHFDGLRSPAGPRNRGLALSTSDFVCFLDSDDYLEPGALDCWLRMATRDRLDVVIARVMHAQGGVVRTPPARPFRARTLDPVRDRLSYRTAPLGLTRRAVMEERSIRYSEGQVTGEDQIVTTRLFFSGLKVGFARRAPSYVVGDDALSRVTLTRRPLEDELLALRNLLVDPFVCGLDRKRRRCIVSRIVRVQLFGAVSARSSLDGWSRDDRELLRQFIELCDEVGTDWEHSFSRADRDLLDALRDIESSDAEIDELARRRRRFVRPGAVLTRDLSRVLSREAPLRVMVASALV